MEAWQRGREARGVPALRIVSGGGRVCFPLIVHPVHLRPLIARSWLPGLCAEVVAPSPEVVTNAAEVVTNAPEVVTATCEVVNSIWLSR